MTACMDAAPAIISSAGGNALSALTRARLWRSFAATLKVATSLSFCQGFSTKSAAPSRIACTATLRSPNAVMSTTTASGSSARIRLSQCRPSVPELRPIAKFMSTRKTSTGVDAIRPSMSAGSPAVSTRSKCCRSRSRAAVSTSGSSSTARIVA